LVVAVDAMKRKYRTLHPGTMMTMISQENMWTVDSPPTPNTIHAGYVY
jgi:hypothetical protein